MNCWRSPKAGPADWFVSEGQSWVVCHALPENPPRAMEGSEHG